jgi:uncharacterized membrane protein YoaK (UPF0700 family)
VSAGANGGNRLDDRNSRIAGDGMSDVLSENAIRPQANGARAATPDEIAALARWKAKLAVLLSVIAGMVDLIGFATLGNIFTAHITGNLVMAAAVMFRRITPAQALAIPVFVFGVAATWAAAKASGKRGPALARHLLVLQFLLLSVVLGFSVATTASATPKGEIAEAIAMVAVFAMACQHALLRLANAPSTAVMTGNITNLVLSFLERKAPGDPLIADWNERLASSLSLLTGFIAGCLVAAVAVYLVQDWSWLLPVGLAIAAIFLR